MAPIFITMIDPPATIVAIRCDVASRPTVSRVGFQRRKQSGGQQADGFRRTIGFDKNQRGVWEHLK